MEQELWRQYVQGALASRDFAPALEICVRALADQSTVTNEKLRGLVEALDTETCSPPGDGPVDLAPALDGALGALADLEEHVELIAEVIQAAGGNSPPDLGELDPAESEAAAAHVKKTEGDVDLARHKHTLRRAAFRASGLSERLLNGTGADEIDLDGYTEIVHQTLAGLRQIRKLMVAGRILLDD